MSKNVFIILSGGPGRYDPMDPEHDQSWANYVWAPQLRFLNGTLPWDKRKEEVHWLVYEPAYVERWQDDLTSKRAAQRTATQKIIKDGYKDYIDKLKKQATKHGWIYKGIASAQEFWDHINGLKAQRVSSLWYFGHSREDLWLSLDHDGSHEAIAPADSAIIKEADIKVMLRAFSFIRQDKSKPHKFFGCNTRSFAETWAKHLKVYAEGSTNELIFDEILDTRGMPTLGASAKWYQISYNGTRQLLFSKYREEVK